MIIEKVWAHGDIGKERTILAALLRENKELRQIPRLEGKGGSKKKIREIGGADPQCFPSMLVSHNARARSAEGETKTKMEMEMKRGGIRCFLT